LRINTKPINGSPKIKNLDSRNEIEKQDYRQNKYSSIDMLMGEWKKSKPRKKNQRETIYRLKEALKACKNIEAEVKLENQRKSIHQSASFPL
jgi:hypothetical protein